MPYITPAMRDKVAVLESNSKGTGFWIDDPGMLNYLVTRLVNQYVLNHGLRYRSLAEVTGVLENVKQELYRRVAAPYEDQKIMDNGDVYSPFLLPDPPPGPIPMFNGKTV